METNHDPVDQTQPVSDIVETNDVTLNEGEQRYKNDLVKFKQEAKDLREKLSAIELGEQQKKGDYQGVIQKLKSDLEATKKSNEQMKYNFANTKLDDAIKLEASEKGIKGKHLDVFMQLIDDNTKGIVEFDDKFNVKRDDVINVVDDTLKRYSDVFKTKVNVVDATPNNNPVNRPDKKEDLSNMSAAQLKAWAIKNKSRFE